MHLAWDDLQTVESLVRHGTTVGAARELGLRHTTVSRRIERLERALGMALFLRETPLRPTALATAIAERARAMRVGAEDIGALLEAERRRLGGQVVIATNDVLAPLLFRALRELAPADGGIEVRVSDLEAELVPGVTDLALRPSHTPGGTLRGQRLGRLRLAIYRPAGRRDAPWLQPSAGLRARASMRWLSVIPDVAPSAVRCDSLLAMREACVAGLGRCVLPVFLGAGDARVERVRDVAGGTPVWLLAPATRAPQDPLRPLRGALTRALRAQPEAWED